VHINPYGEQPVRLALDLVNDPPATAIELAARCHAAGFVTDVAARAEDLAETRAFLADWLAVVDATDGDSRAERLNVLLAGASAYPRLSNHAGDGWHLHYRDPGLSLAAALRALISVGTALHLSGRGMHRLGRCAAGGCARPFADVSRTGRQRYCSPACGNRDAVRRHRAHAAGSKTHAAGTKTLADRRNLHAAGHEG
jgi:predicted RNA-binding Zn ribbon-like protein